MKKIKLNFNKFNIGSLSFDGTTYTFTINEKTKQIMLKSGSDLAFFDTAGKKEAVSEELFLPFKKFLPDTPEKEVLMEQIGILKSDSDFEKLFKICGLSLTKTEFWIELG